MPHHYDTSVSYEKEWHHRANFFYFSKYPNGKIRRYDANTPEHIQFQKQDIDVSILFQDKIVHLSEKFRQKDYGDLLIEIYSKYPEKEGWMDNSVADFLVYFCENKVYIIRKTELYQWYIRENIIEKLSAEIQNFHQQNRGKSSRKSLIYTTQHHHSIRIQLIQAFNQTKDTIWHTISISIMWGDLKNEGLIIKEYELNP